MKDPSKSLLIVNQKLNTIYPANLYTIQKFDLVTLK